MERHETMSGGGGKIEAPYIATFISPYDLICWRRLYTSITSGLVSASRSLACSINHAKTLCCGRSVISDQSWISSSSDGVTATRLSAVSFAIVQSPFIAISAIINRKVAKCQYRRLTTLQVVCYPYWYQTVRIIQHVYHFSPNSVGCQARANLRSSLSHWLTMGNLRRSNCADHGDYRLPILHTRTGRFALGLLPRAALGLARSGVCGRRGDGL